MDAQRYVVIKRDKTVITVSGPFLDADKAKKFARRLSKRPVRFKENEAVVRDFNGIEGNDVTAQIRSKWSNDVKPFLGLLR